MAFPKPVPADKTLHTEGGVKFVARNGKWEKQNIPDVEQGGQNGGQFDFTGKVWTRVDWEYNQVKPSDLIEVYAVMVPSQKCNIDFGLHEQPANTYTPKASYDVDQSSGIVDWGDGGSIRKDMNAEHAWNDNGIWLSLSDSSTRFSGADHPQILKMRMMRITDSHTFISWKFSQQINTGDGVYVSNDARTVVAVPIDGIVGMFFRASAGTFKSGRAVVEVF